MRTWLLLVLLSLVAWAAEPAAMVTDVVGAPVARFSMLAPGSELDLPAGARLQLAFVHGGLVVSCQGPCRVRIDAEGARLLQGTGLTTRRPAPSAPGVPATGVNWDRMAGVRRPSDLHLLGDPARLQPELELAWEAEPRFEEFEVVVERADTLERVSKSVVAASPLRATLAPGDYQVTLTAFAGSERVTTGALPLRVLAPEVARAFEQAWAQRSSLDPGERSLLAVQASELGLYSRARELADRLLQERPGDEQLQRFRQALP